MNLEKAIKTALELEIKIRDIYLEGVQSIQKETGRRIFQILADDEQYHVDFLEHKLEQWQKTGKLAAETLTSTLPAKEVIQKEVAKLQRQMRKDDRGVRQQMLSKALRMEIETSNFYRKMVDQMPDEGRGMFAQFLEIEERHVKAVEFELDYISQTGYWFDFKEFDME